MPDSRAPPRPRRGRRRAGALTLADVAKLAGVSPITVSRALNSPAQLTAETLARVQEAVARSGYVPNRIAGGLASNRSRLVAALVPVALIADWLASGGALGAAIDGYLGFNLAKNSGGLVSLVLFNLSY